MKGVKEEVRAREKQGQTGGREGRREQKKGRGGGEGEERRRGGEEERRGGERRREETRVGVCSAHQDLTSHSRTAGQQDSRTVTAHQRRELENLLHGIGSLKTPFDFSRAQDTAHLKPCRPRYSPSQNL